ncbi:glycosyl hydrolase family 18 protein [Photobacterium sp. DA100]|uniref:glycosyl hydrolase family 18 protein n=1 Tax=Photobacterium sp. DA100 TaxID=3027472 RepID=UPI002479AD2E|nr:glycosyl hydrolase family 18 protein [Photobacterium sp. DA100]WEM43698.1 glycosyl hydrolase family 18 protein [Photobacterium sp. DA100]
MMIRKTPLNLLVCGLISGSALASAPGAPVIGWGEHKYAMVEVSQTAIAYNELVGERKEAVDVTVTWDVWSGDPATSAHVYLDGEEVWSGAGSVKEATFQINKGGIYEMYVELCNDDGCTRSTETKEIVVADTDGSHMEPLEAKFYEKNKPYENKSNSVVSTYYVEWSDYERSYPIDRVPHTNLTHFIYAFIPICGGEGINDSVKEIPGSFEALQRACKGTPDFSVAVHDAWAALQMPKEGASEWSDPYKGNFAQMMAMKQANPDIKIVPSIGGWTLSDPFYFMHDEAKRRTFVESVREFLLTWKFFDGVDIDWEYPGGGGAHPTLGSPQDGELYVTLMRELRQMMDELEAETGREFELSSAVHTSSVKLSVVDFKEAQQYMDYIYVMSYDMYGAFDLENLGHQSGIYQPEHEVPNDFNLNEGVQHLIRTGVDRNRIIAGVPKYGRGWTGVHSFTNDNPMSGRATGAIQGTWDPGVVDYRDIRANRSGGSWEERWDEAAKASYMWNPDTKELITFDNERAVMEKGKYVRENGLGGLMSWEIDGDDGDILNAMHESLGHGDDSQPPADKPPVANAGKDQQVYGPVEVTLDGSASYDPEGEAITYQWTQAGGEPVEIMNADRAKATIFVPAVNEDMNYTFSLTVKDPGGLTGTDTTSVKNLAEEPENLPPEVTLPETLSVDSDTEFSLKAQATDPEGAPLTYSWEYPASFTLVGGQNSSRLTLIAPKTEVDLTEVITVLVSDGQLDTSASTRVTVIGKDETPTPPPSCEDNWSATTTYVKGDEVVHNGKVWEAQWWTEGEEPGTTGEWGVWRLVTDGECGGEEPGPSPEPGDVVEWVAGQTMVENGDIVKYQNQCFAAQNNPGVWETPTTSSWFWKPVNCPE